MADKSNATLKAHPATVETIDGPVPDDHPSHKLRLDAAKDYVARAKKQLALAEAQLAQVEAERKKGN